MVDEEKFLEAFNEEFQDKGLWDEFIRDLSINNPTSVEEIPPALREARDALFLRIRNIIMEMFPYATSEEVDELAHVTMRGFDDEIPEAARNVRDP